MAGTGSGWEKIRLKERIRLKIWRAVEDVQPRVCPVCLTSVRDEDAIGLIGDRIGHAECSVVSWIGSGDELRDAVSAASRPR